MEQKEKLNNGFFVKVFLATLIIFTMVIPVDVFTNQKSHTANAMPTAMMDGQNGCGESITKTGDESSSDDSGDSDSGGSEGSTNGLTKDAKKNIKEIYKTLNGDYGFSAQFIAGILGNWSAETGGTFDPRASEGDVAPFTDKKAENATGNANRGIGYGQWTFERHTGLVNFAKKKDKKWYTKDVQMEFMVKGDSFKQVLIKMAKDSSDDPSENAVNFHKDWEISADDEAKIKANRGEPAKKIYDWMKKNDMDGKKDEGKINKIGKSSGKSSDSGASSADTEGETKTQDVCDKDTDGDGEVGSISGKIGKSVKANGGSGKMIKGGWKYEDVPEKYKKHIELPKLDRKNLENSPFNQSGDTGQCTEFTWAMMNQLYKGEQKPFEGVTNGKDVAKMYKRNGAHTTHNPTVGFGFSASPPYASAKIPSVGHTGVVAGVMDDGKFIVAQFNIPPDPAPSRTVIYSVIDGVPKDAGENLIFFDGMHGGKVEKKYEKKK